jgi:hypothetical protein
MYLGVDISPSKETLNFLCERNDKMSLIKDVWGCVFTGSCFLDLGTSCRLFVGQLHSPAALPPQGRAPVTIGQEAKCAPDPIWTLWRNENDLL